MAKSWFKAASLLLLSAAGLARASLQIVPGATVTGVRHTPLSIPVIFFSSFWDVPAAGKAKDQISAAKRTGANAPH